MIRLSTGTAILALALLLTASAAGAADYYVAPGGSDSNPGTSAAPWLTLQKAANSVTPGSTVNVASGTYVGFQITTSGTASNPIVFRASGSAALVNQPNASTPDNINIEGASYIVIDGFVVEDAPRIGIRVVQATGVIIRNNTVRRSGRTGILTGWTPGVQILNNAASASGEQHGIYVANSDTPTDNPIIRGNECFGNGENGIQLNGDCTSGGDGAIEGALIENNLVHDNNWKGLSIISVQYSTIQNNLMYNNGISAGAGGIHLADEPGCGHPSSHNLIVNNTVVEPRIACIRMTDGSTVDVIFNNICIGSASNKLIDDTVGGNLISTVSNVTRTSATGLFVDAASGDYHLADGANVVNTGEATYQGRSAPSVDMESKVRPAGGVFDPGAYEYAAAPGGDGIAPVATITSPANNATIDVVTTITATASDNVGVQSVQFFLDAVAMGSVDTQAPYTTSLDPNAYPTGFYTLTASARDAAGNVGVSPPVTVFVSNGSSTGIPTGHPRLWLINGELERLRALACYDASGNPLSNCTPSAFTTRFFNYLDTKPQEMEAWQFALGYMISHRASYATTAIQSADQIVACDYTCVANSSKHFLYLRDYMRSVCLVYDWLYDQLTTSQRTSYVNYMNKLMFLTWNETPEKVAIYDTEDWATSNPSNNFYYNFILATTYVALATHGENPGTFTHNGVVHNMYYLMNARDATSERFTDPYEFLMAKMNEQMWPALAGFGDGGGWLEGENYGRMSKRHLFETLLLLKQTAGLDFFNDTTHPFARQALYYELFAIQPGNGVLYPGGDEPNNSEAPVTAYDRHIMLMLATGLKGTVESQYAQYWCNHIVPQMEGIPIMVPIDFQLYDQSLPERDFRQLDTRYIANGAGWVHSRSDWTGDAVAVTLVSTDRLEQHQHRDQNAFVLYKGGSTRGVDGWVLTDMQPFSSGLPSGSSAHNTIVVDGVDQRFGGGTGRILRYEAPPGHTYAVGDASDAYWSNPAAYGHGDQKMVDVFQRELVHILPGYVVCFDRVVLSQGFQSVSVENIFHYPYAQPTSSGGAYIATNDAARLFQKVLLPQSPRITWLDEETISTERNQTWRMTQQDSATRPSYVFLNVFYVTDSSVNQMPSTTLATSQSGNMVGVSIKDPATEYVVMFSADPAGGPPAGNIIYQTTMSGKAEHTLYDLVPGAGYAIALRALPAGLEVTVRAGGTHEASAAGSLTFVPDEISSRPLSIAAN